MSTNCESLWAALEDVLPEEEWTNGGGEALAGASPWAGDAAFDRFLERLTGGGRCEDLEGNSRMVFDELEPLSGVLSAETTDFSHELESCGVSGRRKRNAGQSEDREVAKVAKACGSQCAGGSSQGEAAASSGEPGSPSSLGDSATGSRALMTKVAKDKRSRFIGVRRRGSDRWIAEIKDTTHGVRRWLGTFTSEDEAARAFDRAAREIRGPKTRTNFPPEEEAPSASASPFNASSLASLLPRSTNLPSLQQLTNAAYGGLNLASALSAAGLSSMLQPASAQTLQLQAALASPSLVFALAGAPVTSVAPGASPGVGGASLAASLRAPAHGVKLGGCPGALEQALLASMLSVSQDQIGGCQADGAAQKSPATASLAAPAAAAGALPTLASAPLPPPPPDPSSLGLFRPVFAPKSSFAGLSNLLPSSLFDHLNLSSSPPLAVAPTTPSPSSAPLSSLTEKPQLQDPFFARKGCSAPGVSAAGSSQAISGASGSGLPDVKGQLLVQFAMEQLLLNELARPLAKEAKLLEARRRTLECQTKAPDTGVAKGGNAVSPVPPEEALEKLLAAGNVLGEANASVAGAEGLPTQSSNMEDLPFLDDMGFGCADSEDLFSVVAKAGSVGMGSGFMM